MTTVIASESTAASAGAFLRPKLPKMTASMVDQALSVGGMFLANVALARAQTKEEYGMFALSYSVFTFIAGLHNAALLETYTVYGAGRYQARGPEYRWLIWRSNARLGFLLTAVLLAIWLTLRWTASALASHAFLGMALASGVLLTAALVRRMLYLQRQPLQAAKLSTIFFVTVAVLLFLARASGRLNGLTAFLIAAIGWTAATVVLRKDLPQAVGLTDFLRAQPRHWSEHWKYARWVMATAFVFQLATQGYYWLLAGILSLREVAELRVMYLLVTPVDQVFVALVLLVLPVLALRYASGQLTQMLALWKLYLLSSVAVTAGFALLVRLFARPVMHGIYGGKFDGVAPLLGTLAFLCIIMGAGNAMNAALKAMERPNMVFYAYLASGVTTFLAGIPLVRHYGLAGAVYGMLVSGGVYTVVMGVCLQYVVRTVRNFEKSDDGATNPQDLEDQRSERTIQHASRDGRKRIAIVQGVLTEYRLPVFLEMAERCDIDLVYSSTTPESGYRGAAPQPAPGVRYFHTVAVAPFGARVGMLQWGLAKYILRERPNAILTCCNSRYLSFWTMLALSRLCGIPVHVHGHGMYKKSQINPAYRLMTNTMLRMITSYIAYAPVVGDSFSTFGFDMGKVAVAENSLVNRFPVRPEEKTGGENGILFIGRLRSDSGLDLLIRVIDRIRAQDAIPLTLHIIGEGKGGEKKAGEGNPALQNDPARASWIHRYGECYDPQRIREISLQCCSGCYPGNAGLSVVHLMSLSLPIVTHDDMRSHGPEPSFIEDGVHGVLFDHSNREESLYRALTSLIRDRAQLSRMQHAAFAEYQRISHPSLAARLWSIVDADTSLGSPEFAVTRSQV